MSEQVPQLVPPGVIATEVGEPIGRIAYILSTRRHIRPTARAGIIRLYSREAIAQVRHELNAIAARRADGKAVAHA